MTGRNEALRFMTFVVTSGSSACLNLVVRFFCSKFMLYEAAVALAYVCSTTAAFILARRFVFLSQRKSWSDEYARFVLVNVIGFFQVLSISSSLVRLLFPVVAFSWHPLEVAHLTALSSLLFTSYFLHKHFSFGKF